MKKQVVLIFLVGLFLMSFTWSKTTECLTKLSSEVYNDTASKSLLFMGKPITQEITKACTSLEYTFSDKTGKATSLDLKNVYAITLYAENKLSNSIQLSFCSVDATGNEVWTKTTGIMLPPSSGRYQSFAMSISPSASTFNLTTVSKMKVTVTSESDFLLDEIALNYYKIEEKAPDFEVKKQLKKVKNEFKDKNEQERAERWVRDHGNIR